MRKKNLYVSMAICTALSSGLTIAPTVAYAESPVSYESEMDNLDDDDFEDLDIDDTEETGELPETNVQELVIGVTDEASLENASYVKYQQTPREDYLNTGDIMVSEDGSVYIVVVTETTDEHLNITTKEYAWWKVTEDGLVKEESDVYDFVNTFYYHVLEEKLPLAVSVSTYYGSYLKDIDLPSGYEWKDGDVSLTTIETKTYPAVYTPENTLKYVPVETEITVTTLKLKKNISNVPESVYTVSYYPGTKLSSISLPTGWAWETPDTELSTIGTTVYKAVYEKSDVYEYNGDTEMNITVNVEKSVFSVEGLVITVNEGIKLNDGLLPTFEEGTLTWAESDKEVSSNTTAYCKFTPSDTEHYNSLDSIPVTVNVVPKTEIKVPDTNNSNTNSGNSANTNNTTDNTNNNTGSTTGNTGGTANTTENNNSTNSGNTTTNTDNSGANNSNSGTNTSGNTNSGNVSSNGNSNTGLGLSSKKSDTASDNTSGNNTSGNSTSGSGNSGTGNSSGSGNGTGNTQGSGTSENNGASSQETTLPNLNLSSNTTNDDVYTQTPGSTSGVSANGETHLPTVSLLSHMDTYEQDDVTTEDGKEKKTTEENIEKDNDESATKTDASEDKSEKDTKESKKGVDVAGIIVIIAAVGAGIFLLIKKSRGRSMRR